MNYYDENTRAPRRRATVALAAYLFAVAAALAFVQIGTECPEPAAIVLVELPEKPAPVPPPTPPSPPASQVTTPAPAPETPVRNPEPVRHDEPAPVEQNNPTSGQQEETRTVNPRALFHQSTSGPDDPADAGNRNAPQGDNETARGEGTGSKVQGLDQLDRGLQGRGLVGDLPRPDYPGNRAGKVLVRVTVDREGKVTSAEYEPKGSTTTDAALIAAARRAALQARFTVSTQHVQSGTITYVFRLN